MAKITGCMTGWKGKAGNLVFSMWKGIQCVKTRVIPHNPKTASQIKTRTVFSSIVRVLRPEAIKFIRPFWNPFVGDKSSGWANCIKENMLILDYPFNLNNFIFSKGILEPLHNLAATYNPLNGLLSISWITTSLLNGLGSDHISIILVLEDDEEVQFDEIDTSERDDEGFNVTIPLGLTASNLHLYVLTSKEIPNLTELTLVSNSQHIIPVGV